MSEALHSACLAARPCQHAELSATLSTLAQAGAAQFDPVRWHYVQLLASRAVGQPSLVQPILLSRLARTLASFQVRFAQAQRVTKVVNPPQRRLTAGLADLVCELTERRSMCGAGTACNAGADAANAGPLRTDMRPGPETAEYFRATWAKLYANKRVNGALMQAPKNAGPLNSHNLVLRSLALMRDISPDYLQQLMAYLDTLMCLERHEKTSLVTATPNAKPSAKPAVKADPKPKPKPKLKPRQKPKSKSKSKSGQGQPE